MDGWLGAAALVLVLVSAACGCDIPGLPEAVVEGIIEVESGGNPLALRINFGEGRSLYPKSVNLARRYLAIALRYTDNVDIGLMQVNWRTWRETAGAMGIAAFDLLDAGTNRRLGCLILAQALDGAGSFEERLGRYHSPSPARQRAYVRRVLEAAATIVERSRR